MNVIAAVGAAPVLPAISTLGAVLAFCLAVALSVMWFQILRGPLVKLAGLGVGFVHPFRWLNTVIENVDKWLDAAVKGTERAVTWSFHSLMWSLATTASLTADLAQATWEGLQWWKHHTTKQVGAQTGQSISPRIKTLEREYKGIDARLDRLEERVQNAGAVGAAAPVQDLSVLRRGIDRLQKRVGTVEKEIDAIEHAQTHTGAKAKPGEQAIPRVAPRAVPNTRAPARNWHEVLTKAAAAGLVLSMLGRAGLGWLRCGKVGRVGRLLCGLPSGLALFLFETGTLAFLITDVCKLVTTMQDVAEKFEGLLLAFVNELGGYICGGQTSGPTGIVKSDFTKVSRYPSGTVPGDLAKLTANTVG